MEQNLKRNMKWLLHAMTLVVLLAGYPTGLNGFRPLSCQAAATFRPELRENPRALRQYILSLQNVPELQGFLLSRSLAVQPSNTALGLSDHDGTFIPLAPEGLAVDLFDSNLFGDPSPETILQVRFRDSIYFISVFYQEDGGWHRVPGLIAINREVTSNAPCGLTNPPGEGYFYFSFTEARVAGEYVVVGKTYGGWCPAGGADRASTTQLSVWQITRTGVHRLFDEILENFWSRSPSPALTQAPQDQRCVWTAASSHTPFPKKLRCRAVVYTKGLEMQPDGRQIPIWVPSGTRFEEYDLPYVR